MKALYVFSTLRNGRCAEALRRNSMNAEERQVIDGIFDRLKNVANQPRDVEAEKHIAELVRQQPYAPYALAQSVFVQEQALLNQQAEIEQLKAENARLLQRAEAAPQGGGFLSGLFGGGQQRQPEPREMPAYGQRGPGMAPQGMAPQGMAMQPGQQGPWGGQPQQAAGPWGQQQQPQQRQGMGFLGTAAAAAAGVAGGMVIGNILSSAFGGGGAQAAQSAPNNFFGQQEQAPPQDSQAFNDQQGYEDDPADGGFGFDDGGGDSYDV
jgi:hypothetical protein